MDWKGKNVKWIARIAMGTGLLGVLWLLTPTFLCWLAPIMAQIGILTGLTGYLKFSKEDDNQNRVLSLVGLGAGFVGLFFFMLMFILEWNIWS